MLAGNRQIAEEHGIVHVIFRSFRSFFAVSKSLFKC